MKCLLRNNTTVSGSLNCNGFSRAISRYRNTPCRDIGVSPSNILFGRDLEEQLPAATDVPKVRKQAMAGSNLDKGTRSLPNLNVGDMAVKFAEFESNLGKGARSLPNLTDPRRRKKSGKIVEKLDFDNYLVKVEGGGKLTRGNRRFSTTADKRKIYTFGGESKKANGGDERKGGDGRDKDGREGGDRRWRRFNW